MTLEVATGSVPKRTAVGPLRKVSTWSSSSDDFAFRASLMRLFLATIKVASFLELSDLKLF